MFVASASFTFAEYGIYYGTSQKVANTTFRFETMIIQPYNLSLYKEYTGKKVCYLSVGEFDGTSEELSNLNLSTAVIGYNSEWGSYIMNVSDPKWQTYLIQEEQELRTLGCHGLFLDTLWQD